MALPKTGPTKKLKKSVKHTSTTVSSKENEFAKVATDANNPHRKSAHNLLKLQLDHHHRL